MPHTLLHFSHHSNFYFSSPYLSTSAFVVSVTHFSDSAFPFEILLSSLGFFICCISSFIHCPDSSTPPSFLQRHSLHTVTAFTLFSLSLASSIPSCFSFFSTSSLSARPPSLPKYYLYASPLWYSFISSPQLISVFTQIIILYNWFSFTLPLICPCLF